MAVTQVHNTAIAETPFSEVAPNYYGALMALGENHDQRAAQLGVSKRQFIRYIQGEAFPQATRLMALPDVAAAYLKDLPAMRHLIKLFGPPRQAA